MNGNPDGQHPEPGFDYKLPALIPWLTRVPELFAQGRKIGAAPKRERPGRMVRFAAELAPHDTTVRLSPS